MDSLHVHFKNCFGIQNLEHTFDFSNGNSYAIYARNGLMKTSFAKTFQKIQQGKLDEIKDEIFEFPTICQIQVDGDNISGDKIFVIKSFESAYETDLTSLLINDEIRHQLKAVLAARTKLMKALEKKSGCKIKKTTSGKTVYELEDQFVGDFRFSEKSLLLNLSDLKELLGQVSFSGVLYGTLFDETNMKKIKSAEFQEKIAQFLKRSDEIYDSFGFLEKGNFTLPKLKDVKKTLEKDSFFTQGNEVKLSGADNISTIEALNSKIEEVESALRTDATFQAIENLLSDAKGILLKDILERNPDIVEFLRADRITELRRILWLTYLQESKDLFDDLYKKYRVLATQIDSLSVDHTLWHNALQIYKKRFAVPYEMEIGNLKGAIIGESIPKVSFKFTRDGQSVSMDRNRLEDLDTLSQGEKRALYLLNIIFDVERIKASNQECLFIIDDIADSFDYKNKYAIVEYLCEMAENPNFKLLILSHNFDFYRTVASRLELKRRERLSAEIHADGGITFQEEHYQNQPFKKWKERPDKKNVLALIPFVRNLAEFGKDRHIFSDNDGNAEYTDYLMLTALLHQKSASNTLNFRDLCNVYEGYLDISSFEDDVPLDAGIIETLFSLCDGMTSRNADLEYKILLSMAIRHKAEIFMKREIAAYTGEMTWKESRNKERGSSALFMLFADRNSNQTRTLLNGYKQFGDPKKIQLLEAVNIMTPENIHINSFMYEPILDMDIVELLELYNEVKNLEGQDNG